MSRMFWVAVGAVGGVVAYRRGTRAAQRARELGPLGTAQVAAQATSRLAGRTAHGLGRLSDLKAHREGRLVIGTAQDVTQTEPPVPAEWVPVAATPAIRATGTPGATAAGGPPHTTASSTPRTSRPRRDGSAPNGTRNGQ